MTIRTSYYGCFLFVAGALSIGSALAQTSVDRDLLSTIQKIRAIDDHVHAMPFKRPEPAGADRPDPLGKTPFAYPARLLPTNPEYVDAWRALYGYKQQDMAPYHTRELLQTKLALMLDKGEAYPSWVLDRAGIDVALVNMPSLGAGQTPPHFRWVPRADGFLFPFGGADERIGWFRKEIGLNSQPRNLDAYLDTIRVRVDGWARAGAVAIKFAVAYVRPLDFAPVSEAIAQHLIERHAQGGSLSAADDKALQDFLFHFIAHEAGRLGLIVQIHTGIGAEPYFNISGANPMLLEPMFNDSALRQTNFVLLHGGWPFEHEAGVLLIKPNVYADFSSQGFLRSTDALSATLREWLEWYPEKVLFGSDAYSEDTPLGNWEEKEWLASKTSREALALALTQMMNAGEITRARAVEFANMVLHDNALRLYKLEHPVTTAEQRRGKAN